MLKEQFRLLVNDLLDEETSVVKFIVTKVFDDYVENIIRIQHKLKKEDEATENVKTNKNEKKNYKTN